MAQRINGWGEVKQKWFAKNPPRKDGTYECWICHQPVHSDRVSLDHVMRVEEWPEYAKELSNLRPSHEWCNQAREKGFMNKIKRSLRKKKR